MQQQGVLQVDPTRYQNEKIFGTHQHTGWLDYIGPAQFRTAQLYFSELVNSFDIFAISEHCLFEEQLEILEASINYTYKSTAVSAEDNPSILSGKAAHGVVALFWKNCIKDMVTPLENIDSDCIVGIRCDFNDNSPLFILSVYLPAASHPIEEFNEYLDYLWALYDSLSKTGFVIVMGDFMATWEIL